MRKYLALFLALVLLLSLAGCGREPQVQEENPSYSVNDLLVFQAGALSRQVAMSAESRYLTALSTPSQLLSRAEIFFAAAQAEVLSGKLLREAPENFQVTVTQICASVSGPDDLALCSILAKTDQMHFPKKLSKPAAVYLCYSEECHFVVLFTPGEDGTVAVWAYPLFANTAERVLEQLFADATDLTGNKLRSSCKKAAEAKFEADCPGKEVNAARYSAMAETIFSQAQPLTKWEIALYIHDEAAIAEAMNVSKALSQPAYQIAVYHFGSNAQKQIDQVLSKTAYPGQLQEHTRKMFFLASPNQYCSAYGQKWITISSIFQLCLDLTPPGMNAEKDEEPVLVLMGYGDYCTVALAIYPNRYHTYQYSFSILPVPFNQMQQFLTTTDMKPMQ